MNCSEFHDLLDLFIDGELDDATKARFLQHADECSDCRTRLNAAEQLSDFLSHMDDNIAVPLQAQAAWRSAVRAEARRRRMKRIYAACGAVAAACVLTLGVTAMLRSNPATLNGDSVQQRSVAMVQSDGLSDDAGLEGATAMPGPVVGSSTADYMPVGVLQTAYVDRTIHADDAQTAYGYLMDIVAEYDGVVEGESQEGSQRKVCVRIPGENVTDFISAVDHIGIAAEESEFVVDVSAEEIGICVIIAEP